MTLDNDEMKLIEQVCAGKRESFRVLVETHQQQVFRICFHLLKNTANAEDLAQETFTTAFRKIAQFDPDKGKFSTWLITIANRLCLNSLRKILPISMEEPPDMPAPTRDSPDHLAERSDTFHALDAACQAVHVPCPIDNAEVAAVAFAEDVALVFQCGLKRGA